MPIVAFSPDQSIRRRLALYWGVVPKVMEPVKNADLMAEIVAERLVEDGIAKVGDRVVLVHGSPLGVPGQTNSIRLHEIPRRSSATRASATAFRSDGPNGRDADGDVVACPSTSPPLRGGYAQGERTGSRA